MKARQQKETAFFALAGRFRESRDAEEVKRLGQKLANFVFGDLD